MSALARYYAHYGAIVSGYDKTPTALTAKLEAEGIQIHYEPDIKAIPTDIDLIVYTPAIPASNSEFIHLQSMGIPMVKRAQLMAELVNAYPSVAVAGTHGKTTISSLITHIFKSSGIDVLAFVGGIMKNYGRNLIMSFNPQYCVVEADEYDRSFLHLHPDIEVISAVDPDHLDIYGNFQHLQEAFNGFAGNLKKDGCLILHENVSGIKASAIQRYGLNCIDGLHAENCNLENESYYFDVVSQKQCLMKRVLFPFAGLHNVENALAAISVALKVGISEEKIREALASFAGIHRRFDFRIRHPKLIYIDDYAHHPKEIEALLNGVKGLYPGKRITGIFQPHLFTRTRDLADDFASSLEKLDDVILLDIYPAREVPIEGIDSQFLLNKINSVSKFHVPKKDVLSLLSKLHLEIVLTIGAGDIDQLVPQIEEYLNNSIQGSL